MGVEREGARARHRKVTAASGAEGEFWLSRSESRIESHHEQRTEASGGSGSGGWDKCQTGDCLGQRLDGLDTCLLHSAREVRGDYYNSVAHAPRGGSLILSGVVIPEGLWNEALVAIAGDDGVVRSSILCTGSVFTFRLSDVGRTFAQSLGMTGATLEKGGEFRDCRFEGGLYLDHVDFDNSPFVIYESTIERALASTFSHTDQHVAFVDSDVLCDVRMPGLSGDVRFERTQIHGSLDLSFARTKHLSLRDSHVSQQVELRGLETQSLVLPSLVLDQASTLGPMTSNSVNLSRATFESRTQLIVQADRLDLSHSIWRHGGRLEVTDANIDLTGVVLGSSLAVIGRGKAALISMRDADAGLMSVSTLDLSRCLFSASPRLGAMSVDSTVTMASAPGTLRTRRRCIADEFAWRARNDRIPERWRLPGTVLEEESKDHDLEVVVLPELSPTQVAGTYRSLRQGLEGAGDEPGAADFYYGEMEMRRFDRTSHWTERAVVFLYWLFAGYGLRGSRALLWLLGFIVAGAFVFRETAGSQTRPSAGAALQAAVQAAIPGVDTTVALNTAGTWMEIFLAVVGPILLGLGVLALRNRVKR
jgi:hypothetical protein